MKTNSISFANLICRFGETKVLLDLAREIVLPAFLDHTLLRKSGEDTQYFFYQTELREYQNVFDPDSPVPLLVVHGRFIKNTVLRRTQVFEEEVGLVPNEEAIESAPSAFFVFVLNNHKVIYLPETPHAPALGAFGSTVRAFLRKSHWAYINALHQQSKAADNPIPKKHLLIDFPHPTVDLVPQASKGSIEEFLLTFQTLTRFELQILDTNQELQSSDLYRQIRQVRAELRARKTMLAHESPAGLDKTQAVEQIHAGAATGNQTIRIVGKSEDGSVVTGNNDNVKLRVPIEDVPDDPRLRAQRLIQVYENQLAQGVLARDAAQPNVEQIQQLRQDLEQ